MKNVIPVILAAIVVLVTAPVWAADVPTMTTQELQAVLDSPDVVVIDVRTARDWKSSEQKIRGAIREEPDQTNTWAAHYPTDKTIVLYCA